MGSTPTTLTALGDWPSIRLDRPIVLVGRSPDCDVVIESAKVSRKHCCIAQVDGHLVARDLGSTNGIQVNGRKMDECRLVAGDELSIGNLTYRVDRAGAPPVEKSAPAAYSDSILEKYDVPVPLAETDHGASELLGPFSKPSPAKPPRNKLLETDPEEHYHLEVPDDIRLLPISDSEMKFDRPNPGESKEGNR